MLEQRSGPGLDEEPGTEPSDDVVCDADAPSFTPEADRNQASADLARARIALEQRAQLEQRADAYRIIADWRDELQKRVERITLTAELIGITDDEHYALVDEVDNYKRVCAALGWSPSGTRRRQ
jgi:hypothetical protein